MKKAFLIFSILVFVSTISCKNSNSNKKHKDISNVPVKKEIRAQFQGIVLGSDGAIYLFTDENGKKYDFKDDGKQIVYDLFDDYDQTNPDDMTHIDEWYIIVYENIKVPYYDGSTGKEI